MSASGDLRALVGRNLRREREAAGMSQRALAAAAGVAQGDLSQMENGRINLTLATIEALAKALGIPPTTLTS